MTTSLRNKASQGFLWSAIERFSVQSVQFIFMIIMARLLVPEDYGLIGMLSIFLAVAQSLIDSGFSQALIRKQDRTDIDNSTIFYFNVIISIILYIILYILAPYIATFYKIPELCNIMRVISISIIINAFTVVQRAILTINIDFKTQTKVSFISILFSGVIGIILAHLKYGVWALVIQNIVFASLNTILLWILSKWRPIKAYSWKSFKELFSFGSNLLISGLISTIYQNIYPIIIGKFFSPSNLGYYTRAQHFAEFPSITTTSVLHRVIYPILCSIQDNDLKFKEIYIRFLRLSAYIIFPLMTGLAAVANSFIIIFLGEKWLFCATLLQIICFNLMWYPIHGINLNILQVKGRSDLFLKIEIIKKIIGLIIIFISIPFGVVGMCYGGVFTSILCLMINIIYTKKLTGLGFKIHFKNLTPTLLLSILMFISILIVNLIIEKPHLQLIIGIIEGIFFYLGCSYIFQFSELKELYNLFIKRQ